MKVIIIFFFEDFLLGRAYKVTTLLCVRCWGSSNIEIMHGGGVKKGACHKILWGSGVMPLRTHSVSLSVWCERLHD